MSVLLEQKGGLERKMEHLHKDKAELTDKTLALEILVCNLLALLGLTVEGVHCKSKFDLTHRTYDESG